MKTHFQIWICATEISWEFHYASILVQEISNLIYIISVFRRMETEAKIIQQWTISLMKVQQIVVFWCVSAACSMILVSHLILLTFSIVLGLELPTAFPFQTRWCAMRPSSANTFSKFTKQLSMMGKHQPNELASELISLLSSSKYSFVHINIYSINLNICEMQWWFWSHFHCNQFAAPYRFCRFCVLSISFTSVVSSLLFWNRNAFYLQF